MEFRTRDYSVEEAAFSLPRDRTDKHPLAAQTSSHQVAVLVGKKNEFFDPLRGPGPNADAAIAFEDTQAGEDYSTSGVSDEPSLQLSTKEWVSFKRLLMQRFSAPKKISVSSRFNIIVRSGTAYEKSSTSTHTEELDEQQKFAEKDIKIIMRQEYVSRLHEIKEEISRAWRADDRIMSLKLSIKVASLLVDTSVLQFYPTLFVLVTDIMDMLGNMVWERIRTKAEYTEDGNRVCSLPDDFKASSICSDAKETCNNWFCKIGSVHELLPRIYLELAILPCWRYLHDRPWENLQRLVMMVRGLADPLASAYCHVYMVYRAQKLYPSNIGYLITCINDLKALLMRIISEKENTNRETGENGKLLVSILEPTIEWIMKCLFRNSCQTQVGDILLEIGLRRNQLEVFGKSPCISVILHHLLKELPGEVVSSNASEILHLIECNRDFSFDQCLNYKLLGLKLCEGTPPMDTITSVVDVIFQVVTQYDGLTEYLVVVDAYLDIILQYHMDDYLTMILDGISKRACKKGISDNELEVMQSIFIKLLTHFNDLEDVFALNHFVEILDLMYGSSRDVVGMHIITKATRNGYIRDPTTIQLLFEIAQALHDDIDFSNLKDTNNQQLARLIARFVQMVDYGAEMERHLAFLVDCRAAFGRINELKETLVHSSNHLAVKSLKDANTHPSFVKSCIAFSEVTIPSISAQIKQINLYLETAEVALIGGLITHSDGLVESAIYHLQSSDIINGSQIQVDIDGILSSIQKICSLLVIIPGNPEQGITYIPKKILSVVDSQLWITSQLRVRIFCAVLSLSATLSQNKLPYHATNEEVMGNDLLFFGDLSCYQELSSISSSVLRNMVDIILQESSRASQGRMALEACNCIVASFKVNHEISRTCSKLMEVAKSCLNASDRYLQSTVNFLQKQSSSQSNSQIYDFRVIDNLNDKCAI